VVEKVYKFNSTDQKLIEKIVNNQNVNINHMVLPRGERLPVHNPNSDVYLIIINGAMDIALQQQKPARYTASSIINVLFGIKMDIRNSQSEFLEFFVVKAPISEI